jgi:hypothetical protein
MIKALQAGVQPLHGGYAQQATREQRSQPLKTSPAKVLEALTWPGPHLYRQIDYMYCRCRGEKWLN